MFAFEYQETSSFTVKVIVPRVFQADVKFKKLNNLFSLFAPQTAQATVLLTIPISIAISLRICLKKCRMLEAILRKCVKMN